MSYNNGNKFASKYDPKYVDELYAYIKKTKDRKKNVVLGNGKREVHVTVKLPTYEGFSRTIGVSTVTLWNWAKKHKQFRKALRALKEEQKDRLINNGLAGSYNPTIAKLILSSDHGMKERVDSTTDNKSINNFSDEQIDRIADRVVKRRHGANGSATSERQLN